MGSTADFDKGIIASVTGGSGMVGRRIARRLVAEGHEVRVLSRGEAGADGGVKYFRGGLQDEEVLRRFVSGAHMVFHCASELNIESRMWEVNVRGTERLLRLVGQGSSRYFCYLSSAGVVGRTKAKWVDEETPCSPQNTYEKSKWAAEQLVARGIDGCSVVILRPTNIIDENQSGALIHPMRGSWADVLKVFLKGGECAHIVHADDVAAAALHFAAARQFDQPRCFFVSRDDDPVNTFAGLWSLYKALESGGTGDNVRPMAHLPLQIPYVLRQLWRGAGNRGDVRYSSKKLLSEGFTYPIGVKEAVRRLVSRDADE